MSLEEWETWDRNTYTARMLCEDEGTVTRKGPEGARSLASWMA